MVFQPSRRSVLSAAAMAVLSAGLAACTAWGRRNHKPSERTVQAMDTMAAALRELPGVRTVYLRLVTKAMQRHQIVGSVGLAPDLPTADMVAFGTGAHAIVQDTQIKPYFTLVAARTTIKGSEFLWPIKASSVPSRYGAMVDAVTHEIVQGARSVRITEWDDRGELRLTSYWGHLNETALLLAIPAGIHQIQRHVDYAGLASDTWVNVVMYEGNPTTELPYEEALGHLRPVLQASTTTLWPDHRRWQVKVTDQEADSPAFTTAATDFLRTLRTAGGRWEEIEFGYPWHVMFAIDGTVRMSHWIEGNSDRTAAEPIVHEVVDAANQH